jgi:LysM repeat protein
LLARLERHLYALTAVLVLWVVVVAVTPAMAQAQEAAPTKDTKGTNRNTAERLVVSPGDSLWSITSERLGPSATPQQIAKGVERIYALNQDRIGSDPNLIFVGQKLALPPVSEPSRAEASGAAAPTRETREATKPSEASTREPRPEKEASKTAPNKEANPVALPDMPAEQPAPKVGSPTATDTPSPVESFVRTARSLLSSAASAVVGLFSQDDLLGSRKLLGLGIIALTLLIAGLLAWKLPMRRNVGWFDAGRIPKGFAGGYERLHPRRDPRSTPELTPASPVAEPGSGSFGGEAPAVENGPEDAAGMIVAARRKRERVLRELAGDSRRSPHGELATGAHAPQVIRHLRRARTSAPWWTDTRSRRLHRQSLSPKRGRL